MFKVSNGFKTALTGDPSFHQVSQGLWCCCRDKRKWKIQVRLLTVVSTSAVYVPSKNIVNAEEVSYLL